MTLPPYFPPAAASAMDISHTSPGSPDLKPRLSPEDEAAHLLLSMSGLVSKELRKGQEERDTGAPVASDSEDSLSSSGTSVSSSIDHEDSEMLIERSWNNPKRTVSIDEDASSLPPPVEFVDFHYNHAPDANFMDGHNSYHRTPVPSLLQQQQQYHRILHRPAVITPVRSMPRPLVSMPSHLSPPARPSLPALTASLSSFWHPPQQLMRAPAPASHSPQPPMQLEIPQGFPKLPPLLSMKRDKKHRLEQELQQAHSDMSIHKSSSSSDSEGDEEELGSTRDQADERNLRQETVQAPPKKAKKQEQRQHSCTTPIPAVSKKAIKSPVRKQGKKFSWKNYPELEDFLITNRPEYLRHSAQNYTLEQKDYNNTLTARLIEYAEQCGYGNLLEKECYQQDFGSFTAIRDRIRGYYKSFLQSSRRREQRRQRRLEKQRQAQHQVRLVAA